MFLTQCAPLSSHGDNITWTFAPSRERGLVPVDVHQILLSQYFLFCFDKTLLCLVSVNIWPKNKWDDIWSKSVYYFFFQSSLPVAFCVAILILNVNKSKYKLSQLRLPNQVKKVAEFCEKLKIQWHPESVHRKLEQFIYYQLKKSSTNLRFSIFCPKNNPNDKKSENIGQNFKIIVT